MVECLSLRKNIRSNIIRKATISATILKRRKTDLIVTFEFIFKYASTLSYMGLGGKKCPDPLYGVF